MSTSARNAALFQPFQVGPFTVSHRVVLAPLTRMRADPLHVPLRDLVPEYYAQRASTRGTLLITEATFISEHAGIYPAAPGIWSKEQIDAWRDVTDAVHKAGSYIFMQLWALGRVADAKSLRERGYDLVGPSDIPYHEGGERPRPLTVEEIQGYLDDYEQAARNAKNAGFDGVELHNANGYLPNQFLEDVSNQRTDEYGGSIEKRARFSLEIIERLVRVYGEERVGIRLSPFSTFQGMRMKDPIPQYQYLVDQLAKRHPKLAYLHLVESRISGNVDVTENLERLDALRDAWGHDKTLLRAGGYERDSALKVTQDEPMTAIVVGRRFISNPDLPRRWREGVEETKYDRDLFYNYGQAKGYVDYKAATEPTW